MRVQVKAAEPWAPLNPFQLQPGCPYPPAEQQHPLGVHSSSWLLPSAIPLLPRVQIPFLPPAALRDVLPFATLFLILTICFVFLAWTRSITSKLPQKRFLGKGSVLCLLEGFHWNTLVEDICFSCFPPTCRSLRGFVNSLCRSARSWLDSGNQAAFPCDTKKMLLAVMLGVFFSF